MKHLKAYLSDIPRYKNAQIKEKKRYHFADYKTFVVIPESPPPKSKKVFMVKAKEVFQAQNKEFFQSLMGQLFKKEALHKWNAVLFSNFYLSFHLGKNTHTIVTPQKANRYEEKMGTTKWFPPKKTIEKEGVRFEFFAIDYEFDEIHKYDVLVKEDGSILNKISPKEALCPAISEILNN